MLTKEEQVVYKSGLTDEKGEILFTKIPLDDYLIKVYDETNEVAVQTEVVSVVEDVAKNIIQCGDREADTSFGYCYYGIPCGSERI